jgi:[ribosomal protein S18]-alanine N-acetyltransferase
MIRRAAERDVDAVLAIERSSSAAAHWTEAQYRLALHQSERLFLVAEHEGSILGFLIAFTSAPEWELENVAVLASARRRGAGRALMEALIGGAGQAGATEIRQEIRASNQAAQRLGQSVGFIEEGRRRGYYRDPDEDALLFKYLVGSAPEAQKRPAAAPKNSVKNR